MTTLILYNMDCQSTYATIALIEDYSKGFNRIDHKRIITLLYEMGVPGYLLKLVCGYLTDRKLIIRLKNVVTNKASLPGGAGQGTLLGMWFFLMVANSAGSKAEIELAYMLTQAAPTGVKARQPIRHGQVKWVDDLTKLVGLKHFNFKAKHEEKGCPRKQGLKCYDLGHETEMRERTDPHPREEDDLDYKHEIRPEHNLAQQALDQIDQEATKNTMKVNYSKTTSMFISASESFSCKPRLFLGETRVRTVTKTKILGYIMTSDMKTTENTKHMIKKANAQMWRLRRLADLDTDRNLMIVVVQRYIIPHLELSAPFWHYMITQEETAWLENVMRNALQIVFGTKYGSYKSALKRAGMIRLEERRTKLTKKFAIKTYLDPKFSQWYIKLDSDSQKTTRSREIPLLVKPAILNKERTKKTAIPKFIEIINQNRCEILAKQAIEYPCKICIHEKEETLRFKTKTFEGLRLHMKWKHKSDDYPCFDCEKRYVTKEGLMEHIEVMHKEQTECKICGLKAENEELLKRHLKSHPGRVGCPECGFTYATRMDLRAHMLKHHEDRMITCDLCKVKVTSKRELENHKAFSHSRSYTVFTPGAHGHVTQVSIITHNLSRNTVPSN